MGIQAATGAVGGAVGAAGFTAAVIPVIATAGPRARRPRVAGAAK